MLTVIANYIPAQDPAAGPNYYRFSATARYNVKIDRTGDGKPDIVYRFRFRNNPGSLFLGNTVQRYTVTRIARGRSQVVARGITPPNNIGARTTPAYRQIAAGRVFPLVNAPERNRTDLVQIFATGVPGLNFTGNTIADMLRINLSIPPTPQAGQSRLGGDEGGFPNGRRPEAPGL